MPMPIDELEHKIERRLQRRLDKAGAAGEIPTERAAYRRAAALLPHFDPVSLRPAGDVQTEGAATFHLVRDSDAIGEPGRSLWTLKPEVRSLALAEMHDPKEALQALKRNKDQVSGGYFETMRRYLSANPQPVEAQAKDELARTLQIVRYLSSVPGVESLPAESEVLAALDRATMLEPLKHLVKHGFFGRTRELDKLRDFVGVLPPEQLLTKIESVGSRIGRFLHLEEESPLLVYGPGGIGKSTLIAKFILEHLEVTSESRFPFAYLDFERPTITALEPITLLIEASRQLSFQYPQAAGHFAKLETKGRAEAERQASDEIQLREISGLELEPSLAKQRAQRIRTNRRRRESRLYRQLAELLRYASWRLPETGQAIGDIVGPHGRYVWVTPDKAATATELFQYLAKAIAGREELPDFSEVSEPELGGLAGSWLFDAIHDHRSDWTLVIEGFKGRRLDTELDSLISGLASSIAGLPPDGARLVLVDFKGGFPSDGSDLGGVIVEREFEKTPFLVVLDSFERTQYRSYLHLSRIWGLFEGVQKAYPQLRVVVSGRAPVKGLKLKGREAKELRLKDFKEEEAIAFLVGRSDFPADIARTLVREYGGNPLTLNLLARLAEESPLSEDQLGVAKRWTWRVWSPQAIDDSVVQAMLYERILGQIDDPEVEKLANPGLVLRRITPELIRDVLARYCDLDVRSAERAEELFLKLDRQIDLVERLEPDVLGHRPEVRRIMLRLLEKDNPEMVRAIEKAAVKFYTSKSGTQARAEEIYHRLRLGDDLSEVQSRWEPGVEFYLGDDALADMPDSARAFLSSMLSNLGAEEAFGAPEDQVFQEAASARQARDLLVEGHAEEALEVVDEYSDLTENSPLFAVKADALIGLGKEDEAAAVVGEGIVSLENYRQRSPGSVEAKETLLELRRKSAGFELARQEWALADQELMEVERMAAELDNEIELLQTLLRRVLVRRRLGLSSDPELDEIQQRLKRRFFKASPSELSEHQELVRSIGLEIGAVDAEVLERSIEIVRWPVEIEGGADLAKELSRLSTDSEDWRSWLETSARESGLLLESSDPDELERLILSLANRGNLQPLLSGLARRSEEETELRQLLAVMVSSAEPDDDRRLAV